MKPVRIQLSRKKGFNLQRYSLDLNGLPAVNVARPSKWGNPFPVDEFLGKTMEWAVNSYRTQLLRQSETIKEAKRELSGKNLACWCKSNQICHADVLLKIANEP